MEDFVDAHLNWYVRLCRRRFWKGEYEHDKISVHIRHSMNASKQ